MIQVKEFINYQEGQEYRINKWLEEQDGLIEIIDIKYSVGVFQETLDEFSGVLIIYKIK